MDRSVIDRLMDVYLSNVELIEEGLPGSINSHRAAALEIINLAGLPAFRSEGYRYTDITPRFEGLYEHYFTRPQQPVLPATETASATTTETETETETAATATGPATASGMPFPVRTIDVVNGFVVPSDTFYELGSGVVVGSLAVAAERCPEIVERYYGTLAACDETLAALNTAFMQDGVFVYVPGGVEMEEVLMVNCTAMSEGDDVMSFGRHLLVFGDGAKCKVRFAYTTAGGSRFLMDECREVAVGEGAEVEIVDVCDMNSSSTLVLNSYANQGDRSDFSGMSVGLGCGMCRANLRVDIDGSEARNQINGVYVAGTDERFDYHTIIRHLKKNSASDERFKGIVFDNGIGVFNGLIYVDRAAQQTAAYQNNASLVMSDSARVYTMPQLEIYADNVKCSHGATVGQLDQEALYYMRQRGIGLDDARKLQMFGFVNDIISHSTIEGLVPLLDAAVEAKIEMCASAASEDVVCR